MRKTQFQNFINDWWLCLKYQYPCQFHKQNYIVPLAVRRLLLKVPNVRKPLYSQTGFCSSWDVSSLHGFKAIRPSVSQSVRLSVSISKIRSFGLTAMNERTNERTNQPALVAVNRFELFRYVCDLIGGMPLLKTAIFVVSLMELSIWSCRQLTNKYHWSAICIESKELHSSSCWCSTNMNNQIEIQLSPSLSPAALIEISSITAIRWLKVVATMEALWLVVGQGGSASGGGCIQISKPW